MSKRQPLSDASNMPTFGRWYWKEDTNTLEFISNNPSTDKKKDKKHQKGRATSAGKGGQFGVKRRGLSAKADKDKKNARHTHVILDNVKEVAFDMLSNQQPVSENFENFIDSDQFDYFLLCLLNYFHYYLEKKVQDEKPNPMNVEPSKREKKYYAELLTQIETAQKIVGQSYCILVLGIGMECEHHMKAGTSRVSRTYRDRLMYETLYEFCVFFVWVAFRRKEYENIRKELNRVMRSHTFNPTIRVKNAPDPSTSVDNALLEEDDGEKKILSHSEYQRTKEKRPPIKEIINQRSPVLVSILPKPKQEAEWLFKRQGSHADLSREEVTDDDSWKYEHLSVDISKLHVGIIGEPVSHFHPLTLTPMGTEPEGEEEDEDGEQKSRETRQGSQTAKTPGSTDRRQSREATAVSQVTQEGLPDD